MAEGDSIARLARRLDRQLAGGTVTDCRFLTGPLATVDLTGRRLEQVASAGKHLLARFGRAGGPGAGGPGAGGPGAGGCAAGGRASVTGAPVTVHVHLRMDGRLQVARTARVRVGSGSAGRGASAGRGTSAGALRFAIALGDRSLIGIDVPHVCVVATAEEGREVGHLGPDLCDPAWDGEAAATAVRRLRYRPDRPVIEALLDQRNLAGIGNLYAVEGCFLRGLWPWTPVGAVTDLDGLVDLEHRLLDHGVRTGLMVTTGDRRRGRDHWVYGRSGRPCRRCGAHIRFRPGDGTGASRETWWCPHCQPEPT